ncbi:hypothetical protein KIW84_064118 [Lathyrus oleraceus]|uniref:Protein kinase domain-containing protein n=1 Tax=Pisum sativum TaxID=3888 RepID=A0A9D4WDH7_PEA|nr:hypothetical protein KIW84_064118 [Pisum sativum]
MQPLVNVDFFTEYGEGSIYKIEEVVGKGSYGVVCSAFDTHTGENVAMNFNTKKNTNDQSAPRIAYGNMDHSDAITDFVPLSIVLGHVLIKRRARTPTVKRLSLQFLYLDPIKTTDVKPDVVTSAKGYVAAKAVGSVGSTEKPGSNSCTV